MLIATAILPQPSAPGLFFPIGSYSNICRGFSQAAVTNAKDNQVKILGRASTYSSNPFQITEASARQT